MTAAEHEAAIAQLLAELGDTAGPDAVADTLRAAGIKGVPGKPSRCPIARYLQANGVNAIYVSCMRVEVADGYEYELNLDGGVSDFVSYFDADMAYLDLVEVDG